MKKPQFALLFTTIVFCALVLGVYIGRHQKDAYFRISSETPGATNQPSQEDSLPIQDEPASGLIDINSATKEQLMTLPGIGEVLAQRILEYRSSHGPFRVADELLLIDGIGEGKLNNIRPYITVGGSS